MGALRAIAGAILAGAAVVIARHLTHDELVALYGGPGGVDHYDAAAGVRAAAANVTLRQAAAAKGLFMGSAANYYTLNNASEPVYRSTLVAQYDLATAENGCKFAPTEPGNGEFSFTQCDYVSNFALTGEGGVFRGHNWAWGQSNPSWLVNGSFTPAQLEAALQTHVSTLAGRYNGKFYCWDAVNEAITDDASSPDIFKTAPPWYPAIPDYVNRTFQYGHAIDAGVKLFYNDYGAEGSGVKSDRVYDMVASMKAGGLPIAGVGLQMHISVDAYPSPASVAANIKRLGDLGIEVHITEMDVRCTPPCGADRLDTQGDIYAGMLQACLNNTNCKSFETWGFTDRYTWLWSYDNPTHADMQPLPFDVNYNAKPAFYKMLALLTGD